MENKIFRFSLIISFLIHAMILVCLFYSDVRYYEKIKTQTIEVVYRAQGEGGQEKFPIKSSIKSMRKKERIKKLEIFPGRNKIPSPVLNDLSKHPIHLETRKKQVLQILSSGRRRQIVVPLFESEKISNPKYLNYHERIRNKIRNRAYFYVDDPRFDSGEVYLTFMLSSDGSLKEIKIINNKTVANDYLRNIGLRSIKESSPFPAFPSDLKYPELSFNIVISFEINE